MSLASDPALAAGVVLPDCRAVLDLLAAHLSTGLGRAELERVRFHRDPAEIERLQRLGAEARRWIARRGGFQFSSLEADPRPLLAEARVPGAGLPAEVLLALLRYLDAAAALREHLLGDEAEALWPGLRAMAAAIPELAELRHTLHAALLPNGALDDNASPELARLRRQRLRQRQAIEAALAQHLRRLGAEGALQDEIVTIRNERFVLPVRAEARRRAPGIVHGASSSGQTVFVEPLETIDLNNDYIRLIDAEQAEIQRILAALTHEVAAAGEAIAAGAELCGELELEAAKARFAADYGGAECEIDTSDAPVLQLQNARHPVLIAALRGQPGRAVIPLSLALGRERLLVISGPNTGGKTVVLKTVGMAVWMAQCGLPVCAERARLPVFDAIWADIGDVQSIEQNLSTFSSHLLHIRGILESATAASLVLLDELGTATNAAEGAALAVEIAESLVRRRAWTLISTHHDSMKEWASTRDGVANGSVMVDPITLAPSYRFRFGVPGLSAGLDMAERLGLPPEIVAGARARLTEDQRQAATYLQTLQQKLAQAEDSVADLQRREVDLTAQERAVEARERVLAAHDRAYQQQKLAAMRAELDRRLAHFIAGAEANWRSALGELQAEITAAQKRKLALATARLKRETTEAFQAGVASALGEAAAPAAPAAPARAPKPGDRVRLRNLSQPARVLRAVGGGAFEVEAGALRMQVSAADITAIIGAPMAPIPAQQADTPAIAEVNLIGLRADEAIERLEKFLDQSLLADVGQVRIVHGAGFGVLRKAVADALRAHPQVARFSHPPQNEGGQGVTLAEFR